MTDAIEFFPVEVEQTTWQAAADTLKAIRHTVFVEEQGVPEAMEVDDRDPEATHWLARSPDGEAIATARLAGDKVGRMAVFAPHRKQGVGASLLRAIIRHAVETGIPRLQLDAQEEAEPFYSNNGFSVDGETFMDAGIPHVPMSMDLARFQQPRPGPEPPEVDDALRRRISLASAADFADAAHQLVGRSNRTVRIFSECVDPAIYDRQDLARAVLDLSVRHPNTRVWILVRDTEALGKHFHQLIAIYDRLRSHIELRRLTEELDTSLTEFATGDEQTVLYRQSPDRYQGYLCLYDPVAVRRLNAEFDELWIHSQPDPRVRRLYI